MTGYCEKCATRVHTSDHVNESRLRIVACTFDADDFVKDLKLAIGDE